MWLAIFIICVIPFITVLVNRATIEYNAIKRYAGVSLYMSSKSIIVIGYFIVFFLFLLSDQPMLDVILNHILIFLIR